MAQIIKVASGETIQVRTGVLQGIGPQGPIGPTGPQGIQGDQGPQGPQGPMGVINQMNSEAVLLSAMTVAPDTQTLVTFDSAIRDELTVIASATSFKAPAAMDVFFMVWVRFDAPADQVADSWRHVELYSSNQGVFAAQSLTATTDGANPIDFNLSATLRMTAGEQVQVRVQHSDTSNLGVSKGRIAMYRVGSGPAGPTGPTGGVGPQGPQGPTGPQGPAGNANSGFATYAGLHT